VIRNSARITVFANTSIEYVVDTARLSYTLVLGAFVSVFTEMNISTFQQLGLVNLTVAIVIQAVANLKCRHQCIARTKSAIGTCTLANALAELVGKKAGGGQTKCYRTVGARAFSRIVDTLLESCPLHSFRLLA